MKGLSRETAARADTSLYVRPMKRVIDVGFALVGLLVASPILLVCAIAVRLSSRGPVFFRQWRVGQKERPFQVIKLRTMAAESDHQGSGITAADDLRITRVGRWLRRTKLDEIPQLWNVLRGEMSLVGPRPELPEYVRAYSDDQRKVLQLKPGLTGPSSVAFLDEEEILACQPDRGAYYLEILLPRKLELDLRYSETVNFFGDIKHIVLTLAKLIRHPGDKMKRSQP